MKEDIRISGMHEVVEDSRRDITTEYVVGNNTKSGELLKNEILRSNHSVNEHNDRKVVTPKVIRKLVEDNNNKGTSNNDSNANSNLYVINNTTDLQIERIPSFAHKQKLAITNLTLDISSPVIANVNEFDIIKEALRDIMNLNGSFDKGEDTINKTNGGSIFLENLTSSLMNFSSKNENSTANNETSIKSAHLNATIKNNIIVSDLRRDFEAGSLRSSYTKTSENSKKVMRGNTNKRKSRQRGSPAEFNFQRRDFALDSLKSIYTKGNESILITGRNANVTLYELPFNLTGQQAVLTNITMTANSSQTKNISKGLQKLNAVLFKIPEIISKMNETIGNYSVGNHTNRGRRLFNIDSLKSQYTKNVPKNIKIPAVNDKGDILKKALKDSNFEPQSNVKTITHETTTNTRQNINRRYIPEGDPENLKTVIDLGVFKKLMEAARQNKKVHRIPIETSTVDTTTNSGDDSGEKKFVNVWRETYLKPKAKLTEKTGALINLINRMNWNLAKSDKRAMENIYGPAANQSLVPQFRRLWDFFWEWYYDPDSKLHFFYFDHTGQHFPV